MPPERKEWERWLKGNPWAEQSDFFPELADAWEDAYWSGYRHGYEVREWELQNLPDTPSE